jgi:ferredoxin-NADP reductase
MKAKLVNRKLIAEQTLWIEIKPEGEFKYIPGHYCSLTLTKSPYEDHLNNKRELSILSSPTQENLEFAIRLTESPFKKYLQEMEIGEEVELSTPLGILKIPDNQKPLLFLTGGIGITPFISMLRYLKEKDNTRKVILLYSNQTEKASSFLDELKELKESMPNFNYFLTMTRQEDWKGKKDRFDEAFLKENIENIQEYDCSVVGPTSFIPSMFKALKNLKVDSSQLHVEAFTGF